MSLRDLRRTSAELDEQPDTATAAAASRRSFLRRAATGGVIAAGATAVPVGALIPSALAQSTTPGTGGVTSGTTPGTAIAGTTVPASPNTPTTKKKDPPTAEGADLTLAVFLQTIELAAVAAYDAIGATGKLASAVAENARVAGMFHQDQADALNTFVGSEGLYRANDTLAGQLLTSIAGATSSEQLVQIAYDLEESVTATWAHAMGELENWEIAAVAATIMPVSSQRALAWSLELESDIAVWAEDIKTWIPNFQNDSSRLDPAQFAAG